MLNEAELGRRVKTAVENIACPAQLEFTILAKLAPTAPQPFSRVSFALMFCIGVALSWQAASLHNNSVTEDGYIAGISHRIPIAFRPGLQDHVHCAVLGHLPVHPLTLPELAQQVGPSYAPLIAVMQRHAPAHFHIVAAHRCQYKRAQFIHITLTDGRKRMSLILTPRPANGGLSRGDLIATASVDQFQIAMFELHGFTAYLLSDLPPAQNLSIASAIAPEVHRLFS